MNENTENLSRMRDEIARRINDANWNFEIAGSVLKRRRRSRALWLSAGSAVALALSALVFFNTALFRVTETPPAAYYGMTSMINSQVEGTYTGVFTYSKSDQNIREKTEYVGYRYEHVDSLIDDALVTR